MSLYTVQNLVLVSAIIAWIIFVVFLLVKQKDKYELGSQVPDVYFGDSGSQAPDVYFGDSGSQAPDVYFGDSGSGDKNPYMSYMSHRGTCIAPLNGQLGYGKFSIRVAVPVPGSPNNNYLGVSSDDIILTTFENRAIFQIRPGSYYKNTLVVKGIDGIMKSIIVSGKNGNRPVLIPYNQFNDTYNGSYIIAPFNTSSQNNGIIDVKNVWSISSLEKDYSLFYYSGGPAEWEPLTGMANVVFCEIEEFYTGR